MDKIKEFQRIASELSKMYKQKNSAYGDSFGTSFKKYGKISALTRISDKFNRFENLILNENIDANDEKVEDTLRDLASYCIMTIVEIESSSENKEKSSNKLLG